MFLPQSMQSYAMGIKYVPDRGTMQNKMNRY
jgi:hypothetical protein